MKTGKHIVTALARADSKNKLPEGVKTAHIDYEDESTLVAALQGQQFLIITLSVTALDKELILIRAAAKAGVPHIMTNCYGVDPQNEALAKDMPPTSKAVTEACNEIESLGVSSWTALVCNLWYEYSLISGPEWFGFDFKNKHMTFYDDGKTRINTTTWEQCARAIASLVSLKIFPDVKNDSSPTVSTWANKPLYISSFLLNQKEIFESWKRISGDKDEDWTLEYEPSIERRKRGLAMIENGDMKGFGLAMFPRVFYQNGDGEYGSKYGLANETLGLPQEDLDERTKVAKKVLDSGYSYVTRSY